MYAKLGLRNVKRQITTYLIYFITVIFTVSLMFAINNILFDKKLLNLVSSVNYSTGILIFFIVLITLVVGFIICYATVFLLRKRKKELGIYLLLGIKRQNILKIFIIENMVISILSFIFGCLFGLIVFQLISGIVCAIMGHNFGPLSYNLNSLWLTFLQWFFIFITTTLYSSRVLRKSKINDLVTEKVNTRKLPINPKKGVIIVLIMLVVIVLLCLIELWSFSEIFYIWQKRESLLPENTNFALIFIGAVILAITIFVFYFYTKSFYLLRLNSKKRYKGSYIFHLRQMVSTLNKNSVIIGIIAVLMSFAFIFTNLSFSTRYMQIEEINTYMPYDVIGVWQKNGPLSGQPNDKGSSEEVIAEAQKYSSITFSHEFNVYDTEVDLMNDYFNTSLSIKENDLNALLKEQKQSIIDIAEDEFYIIIDVSINNINDYRYNWFKEGDIINKAICQGYIGRAFLVAVSDNILTSLEWEEKHNQTVLTLNSKDYLPHEFYNKFAQYNVIVEDENFWGWYEEWSNIGSKYYYIDRINADSSIMLVVALYLSLTFMFISMALLSLKIMSEADKDKKRYSILNMLGADEKRQRSILFKQLITFFSTPLVIPLFIAIPSLGISLILSMGRLNYVPAMIYVIGIAIPLIYIAIYICYFTATYYLLVKNNIKPIEKPRVTMLSSD